MHPRRLAAAVLAAAALPALFPQVSRALSGSDQPSAPAVVSVSAPSAAVGLVADVAVTAVVAARDLDDAHHAVAAAGLDELAVYQGLDMIAVSATPAQIEALESRAGVISVTVDAPLTYSLSTAHDATRANEARQSAAGLLDDADLPFDGTGVGVAVIDSGVDGTHPFFRRSDGSSKIVRNLRAACLSFCVSFVDVPDSDTPGAGGHGTHVSGIVGGFERTTGDGETVRGAAPGSDLYVLGTGVGINVVDALSSMNWVVQHHANPCEDLDEVCTPIKVLNNSWGSSGAYNPNDAISLATSKLVDDGVTVVFAAGNDGGDGTSDQVNPYAKNPKPGVLSVANYDDGEAGLRDNALDSSSSRGKRGVAATYPDVAAPGTNIRSSCRPYLPICYLGLDPTGDANHEYYNLSGTSMAAPYVAGIVAVLLQANPALSPSDVEDILEDTAHKFGSSADYESDPTNLDDSTSFDKGHGLIDVVEALARALGRTTTPITGCEPGSTSTSFADAPGDGHAVIVPTHADLNEPALDILNVNVDWDSDAQLATFDVKVADLTELPPRGSMGEYYDMNFTVNGVSYYLLAQWDRVRGLNGPTFTLGQFQTTRTTLATGLEGTFDVDADTITVYLPKVVAKSPTDPTPALTLSGSLSGFDIVSRRISGVVVPDADHAVGGCPVDIA